MALCAIRSLSPICTPVVHLDWIQTLRGIFRHLVHKTGKFRYHKIKSSSLGSLPMSYTCKAYIMPIQFFQHLIVQWVCNPNNSCTVDDDIFSDTSVTFDSWSDWSDCSTTCGSGVMTRSRTCQAGCNDVPNDDLNESQNCKIHDCPGKD